MAKSNMVCNDCSKCKGFIFGSCSFEIEVNMLEEDGSCIDLQTEYVTVPNDDNSEYIRDTWNAYKYGTK